MKRKLEISEFIFKLISYLLLTMFAIGCLYPFIYTISSAISGYEEVRDAKIVLFPKNIQFDAFKDEFNDNVFWNSYTNTLFITFYGTIWQMIISVFGAYALSKKRLLFRKGFNFFLVFTMWFSAGMVPQYLNYLATKRNFQKVGITDDKWLVVIAMGMAAMNIILLRNAFERVPSEIEEAAIVDGATEMQILRKVYLPMSKSILATVALFFGISRWNGYFWSRQMISNTNEQPLQVYLRLRLEEYSDPELTTNWQLSHSYAPDSIIYALIVCSIIPILVIYPFIQKYFAKGVNMGGVKE
ncbi:MAG: carbohydrate ABC transporter permease [Lachnospiraceae bacterium]|nr:carbohydrate ABC transporter permease [Lachnospiraceae bacterium]